MICKVNVWEKVYVNDIVVNIMYVMPGRDNNSSVWLIFGLPSKWWN